MRKIKNSCDVDLYKAINKRKVLEIGSNYGDIASQILNMDPKKLVASEVDKSFLQHLEVRFNNSNNNISVSELDIFNPRKDFKAQFDTVILKEIINAFESKYYNAILSNSLLFLHNEGSLVIIDYLPHVHIRQLVTSILMSPLRTYKHIERYKYNIKHKEQLDYKKLHKYFKEHKASVSFYKNVDPLNEFDSLLHKILEKIFPMKYMFIVKKDKFK